MAPGSAFAPGAGPGTVGRHALPRRCGSLPERWLLLGALAAATACRAGDGTTQERPSILLVTMDGLRGDEPAWAGGASGATPRLDALAAQGSVWLRAYAPAPLDVVSRATILTGLEPRAHGVHDDGDFVLAEGVATLPGALAEAGWTSASLTSSILADRRWGLDRGFTAVVDRQSLDPVFGEDPPGDERVVEAALEAFASTPGPLFAWVDLAGPHWPWSGDDADPRRAEIAAADAHLGQLLDAWDARAGASIVVVTSPHGESLGEGGERTHGLLLHDATLRVPLVIRGDGFPAGERSANPVGLVDVAPTLLAAAGVPKLRAMLGRDLRDGGSQLVLSESLAGQHVFGLAPLHALTDVTGRYVEGTWAAFYPVAGDGISTEPSVRLSREGASGQRLAAALAGVTPVDPAQAAIDPQAWGDLATLGYVGGDPLATPGDVDPRDAMDTIPLAMQARRYLDAGLTGRASASLKELDRRMPSGFGVQLTEGRLLWQQGRLREAEDHWRTMMEGTPSGTVALQLAALLAAQDRWEEAAPVYDEAGRLDPTSREAVAGRLRALRRMGSADLAEDLALRYLAAADDQGELAPIRAETLLDAGEPESALEEARRGVEAQPWSPWARSALGRVFWEMGLADRAVAELEEAVRLDPYTAAFRIRLATWLLDQQRALEAVRVLAPPARLMPDHLELAALYEQARGAVTEEDKHRVRADRAHTLNR